jgi:thioredoxin 1
MAVEVLSDEQFVEKLKENKKSVVKYYAGWCGSCRLFAPKFKRLSEDPRFTGIKFVDVDAELSPEARKMAGVSNLPYFAIFNEDRLVDAKATSKEDQVVELINQLVNT